MGRRIRSEADAAATAAAHADRVCARCGRRMPEGAAAEARWCSAQCRRAGITEQDVAMERTILSMLDARAATSSICPSDVARSMAEDWRPLMEPVRRAARRLVAAGVVDITQGGSVIDPSTAKGPIRIRRSR